MPSDNPFHVPVDEEVFALRDEEAQRKRAEREQAKQQHVWEKGVKKNPSAAMMAELAGSDGSAALQQSKLNLVAAATRDRRKEKEHMGEFIAKKREMFLVQMSLDTKRAEIRKLEERAQQREEVRTAPARARRVLRAARQRCRHDLAAGVAASHARVRRCRRRRRLPLWWQDMAAGARCSGAAIMRGWHCLSARVSLPACLSARMPIGAAAELLVTAPACDCALTCSLRRGGARYGALVRLCADVMLRVLAIVAGAQEERADAGGRRAPLRSVLKGQ